MTTLRVTSWDELTLISFAIQIRFIASWFIEFSCNKFSICSSTWSSSNHHRWIIFSKSFILLKTTIESISTRMLSSKMNWILLLRIANFSTSMSFTCSISEISTIEKIIFFEKSFRIISNVESKLISINWTSTSESL